MAYGPYIDNESDGFGVPGVAIKPTLSSLFDPYSGINLLNGASCADIEVVTNYIDETNHLLLIVLDQNQEIIIL